MPSFKSNLYLKDNFVLKNEKIVRICWNSNYWESPSGPRGKSLNQDSFEYKYGYGHEEWLFNDERIIDGYIYGFIQALNTKNDIHVNKIYTINLYTLQTLSKSRNIKWWLGKVKNVEVIDRNKSTEISSIYNENGWNQEIVEQLIAVNADISAYKNTPVEINFNCRFKPEDLDLFDSPVEIAKDNQAIKHYYYKIQDKLTEPTLIHNNSFTPEFIPGHTPKSTTHVTGVKTPEYQCELLHNQYQTSIFEILKNIHGDSVRTEFPVCFRTKVDFAIKKKNGYIFYELKTNKHIKQSVREALGQIIEYAYWPNNVRANKLVIISTEEPNVDIKKYMAHLRTKFQLPIHYQHYDAVNNTLGAEI